MLDGEDQKSCFMYHSLDFARVKCLQLQLKKQNFKEMITYWGKSLIFVSEKSPLKLKKNQQKFSSNSQLKTHELSKNLSKNSVETQ